MKIKTTELTGAALDWAVAKGEGYVPISHSRLATVMVERRDTRGAMVPTHISSLRFSTEWVLGGPIMHREQIDINHYEGGCFATLQSGIQCKGPDELTAAMRCYVVSKLGNEVDVPEELLASEPAQATDPAPRMARRAKP
jgi:hypothetical protein